MLRHILPASKIALRSRATIVASNKIVAVRRSFAALSSPRPSPSRPSLLSLRPVARMYSAPAGLSKDEVEGRILDILRNFDKVTDASQLTDTSNFAKDLGLDSLDIVEVVMAIEEEFSIEIPDKEADRIQSIDKAIEYILSQPDAQ